MFSRPIHFGPFFALAMVGTAAAGVVAVTSAGIDQGPAAGVDLQNWQSESADVQLFHEAHSVAVADGSLEVDLLVGDNLAVGDSFTGVTGQYDPINNRPLPAGIYDSHILHFDPVDWAGFARNAVFSFETPIVALIRVDTNSVSLLDNSDPTFGTAGAYSPKPRKWDLGENPDQGTLVDPYTVKVDYIYARYGNADELRVITISDEDRDGVYDTDDLCPGTALTDLDAGVPSDGALGRNRWADLDGDGIFETDSNQSVTDPYTIEETGGCNCAQILDLFALQGGHVRFGCNSATMDDAVLWASQQ